MTRKIISLFSGAGGMDLGFIQAGFEVIWANDFDLTAIKTYQRNIGNHIVLGDITKIKSDDIPLKENEVDLVIGGFPCQGFSIANKNRNMEDKRNFLYKEMLRIINDKKPKFFVAENVKGLLSMQKGKVIEMIIQDFTGLGYKVDVKLLNAADYGVPQQRERIIIMGNRLGVENSFPTITHTDIFPGENNYNKLDLKFTSTNYKPYITVEQTIGFLQDIPTRNNYLNDMIEVNGRKIYNHIANTTVKDTFWGRKYEINQHDICDYLKYWRDRSGWSTKKVDEYFGYKHTAGHWFRKDNNSGSIPKPEDWWKLKEILGFDDMYDKEVTTFIEKPIKFEQSLRITNWNRASDTITATSPEIHINKERRLSVRECALIQTFPDNFIFEGSLNAMYRQIGNAVPPLLAKKIAECILKNLDDFEGEEDGNRQEKTTGTSKDRRNRIKIS